MMFVLAATGARGSDHWQQVLQGETAVRLGRQPKSGIAVPWDPLISREHCDLLVDDERLYVRCLPSARKTAFLAGRPATIFSVGIGESFRIGGTRFEFQRVESRTDRSLTSPGLGDARAASSVVPPKRSWRGKDDRERTRSRSKNSDSLSVPPSASSSAPLSAPPLSPTPEVPTGFPLTGSLDEWRLRLESEVKLRRKAEEQIQFCQFEIQQLREAHAERHFQRGVSSAGSPPPSAEDQVPALELRTIAETLRAAYAALDRSSAGTDQLASENQRLRQEVAELRNEVAQLKTSLEDRDRRIALTQKILGGEATP